jgi:hypothetical protein
MTTEDFRSVINKAMIGGMNKEEILDAMVDELIKVEGARENFMKTIDEKARAKYGIGVY